jgi:hypothetical protein
VVIAVLKGWADASGLRSPPPVPYAPGSIAAVADTTNELMPARSDLPLKNTLMNVRIEVCETAGVWQFSFQTSAASNY